MQTTVVACRTIEDELRFAMKKTGTDYPVVWLESGLHNVPKKLNKTLQEALDGIRAERVLMGLGFCGNALAGVRVPAYELIFPRVDDCISLLLGSARRRLEVSAEHAAYFFTEGWLRGERNIWVEHEYMLEKYGEDVTEELEKSMYGHYRTLGLLDCGVNPIEPLVAGTRMIAEGLHLQQEIIPAGIGYIEALLTGPWTEERFITKKPGTEITGVDLQLW